MAVFRQPVLCSCVSVSSTPGLAFELDQDEMHRLIANVLSGMGQRVAIDNVARLERAFRNLAISSVVAIATPLQNINDVGGVRVYLLLGTRWQGSFEDAYTLVFESDAYRPGIDDGGILRVCRRHPHADG